MSGATLVELVDADVAHEEDPQRVVVHDVSWTVRDGEWWVVAGPPGSGKTALLTAAAGLNPPVRGSVRLFGNALDETPDAEQVEWRRRIGFVFEGGGRLLARLSLSENLALPLRYHEGLGPDAARERALALLARAGLEAMADERPSRLSTAMQQRVALLRALAGPTRLLFLDDPLRGLAASDVRWWLDFLRRVRAEHDPGRPLAVVTSAYDFTPWREHAGHRALVEEGRFRVVDGDPSAPAALPGSPR